MTWVRLDDGFAQHPKVVAAGPLAMAMQVAALCYCNKNLTDGFVPWPVAQSLLSWEFLGQENDRGRPVFRIGVSCGMAGDDVTCQTAINALLLNGMWEETDGGFQIHDYLDYQPSKAEILALRVTRSNAGKVGGRKKHRQSADVSHKQDAKQDESNLLNKNQAKGTGIGIGISEQGSDPVDRAPAPEDETGLQGRIKGRWMREMQTQKRDANPRPPDRDLESAVKWAVGRPWGDVERAIVALVADDDKWVSDNSWRLGLLERRGTTYLATAKQPSATSGFDCSRIAELDEPPEPPPGWVPPPAPVRRKDTPRG